VFLCRFGQCTISEKSGKPDTDRPEFPLFGDLIVALKVCKRPEEPRYFSSVPKFHAQLQRPTQFDRGTGERQRGSEPRQEAKHEVEFLITSPLKVYLRL